MEEIARYTESHIQVKRQFVLYPDRVQVQADWKTRGHKENKVELANLSPDFTAFHVRNKLFKIALVIVLIGMAIALLAGDVDKLREMRPLPVTGIAILLVGLLLAWRTSKRIRFVRFLSREGKPALDIGCPSRDRTTFDEFVRAVQKQIRRAR